ncbi:MAG: endonuclease/exonuclease/phosphatase family protein [Sinimarinibacterium sp.]
MHKGFSFLNRRLVLHELREAVRDAGAEIVFLQEVVGAHEGHAARHALWPKTPHYEFLADQIWRDFAYGRNAVYPKGHHGNALLSKFPIVSHRNHDISGDDRDERRGLLHCVVDLPGPAPRLHTICVHLGLFASQRRRQLGLLCGLVESGVPDDAPLVIAGDFNDWRMEVHRTMRCEGLKEVFVATCGAAARSFPARWPLLRLDRIYIRNLGICDHAVLALRPWSHLSDHAGLLAEIAA